MDARLHGGRGGNMYSSRQLGFKYGHILKVRRQKRLLKGQYFYD